MEVERFKHRQLAPTVGPSSRSLGEFEGHYQDQSTRQVKAWRLDLHAAIRNTGFLPAASKQSPAMSQFFKSNPRQNKAILLCSYQFRSGDLEEFHEKNYRL
jgi:succinylglutamate desuccinylase